MSQIFNAGYNTEPVQRKGYGDFTFGKQQQEGDRTPSSTTSYAPDDLCAGCLNEQMARRHRKQKELEKERELQNYQKHLDDLKKNQEKEKRFQAALKEDLRKFYPEEVKKPPKKIETEIEENRFATEYIQNPKLAQYAELIKKEAKNPIEKKKKRPEDAEKVMTGLPLDPIDEHKKKLQRIEQKEILELQIKEKELKKLKDKKNKDNGVPELDNQFYKRQMLIENDEKKKKDEIKADYSNHMKDQEKQKLNKKQQREKEIEDGLTSLREAQRQADAEKKAELDKKRDLGNYLSHQIQEKTAKKPLSDGGDFVDPMIHSEDLVKKPYFDPVKVKNDNALLRKQRMTEKELEKEKNREFDLEYLKREKAIDDERKKEELQKRNQYKHDIEDSLMAEKMKKAQEMEEKARERHELDYYDKLNSGMLDEIKLEKAANKNMANDYNKSLEEQQKLRDELKKKDHDNQLAAEKASKGLPLDSYAKAEAQRQAKEKYKQDIEKQYKDSLLYKNKPKNGDEVPGQSIYDKMIEKEIKDHEQEDQKKKDTLKKDYINSKRDLESKKKQDQDKKIHELNSRLKDLENEKADLMKLKKKEREAQKQLANDLKLQEDMNKIKKQRQKEMERHANELDRKISDIKDELKKCAKCNKDIVKPKKAF